MPRRFRSLAPPWTRSLEGESAPRGITVDVVCPGPPDTELCIEGKSADPIQKFAQASVFGRWGQPGENAEVIALLASEVANWATGQNMRGKGPPAARGPHTGRLPVDHDPWAALWRARPPCSFLENVPSLFGRSAERPALRPCNRAVLFLDNCHHPLQSPQQIRHLLEKCSRQEPSLARQQRRQVRGVQTGQVRSVPLPGGQAARHGKAPGEEPCPTDKLTLPSATD